MSSYKFANDVLSELDAGITAGATTIVVVDASAPYNNFPDPGADEVGYATITDNIYAPTSKEIITYTGVTDNGNGTHSLTGVTRGVDGTSGTAFSAGAAIYQASVAATTLVPQANSTDTTAGRAALAQHAALTGVSNNFTVDQQFSARVGIGTASPLVKSHVEDNKTTAYSTSIPTSGGTPNGTEIAMVANGDNSSTNNKYALEAFQVGAGSGQSNIFARWGLVRTGASAGAFVWQLRNVVNSANTSEAMRLTDDGWLGVGTSTPREKGDFAGRVRAEQFITDTVTDNGNSGTAKTIDWGASDIQKLSVNNNTTLTFTDPPGSCRLQLLLNNSSATNTITLPSSVTFVSGAQSTDNGAKYVLSLVFDGTDYWASWST